MSLKNKIKLSVAAMLVGITCMVSGQKASAQTTSELEATNTIVSVVEEVATEEDVVVDEIIEDIVIQIPENNESVDEDITIEIPENNGSVNEDITIEIPENNGSVDEDITIEMPENNMPEEDSKDDIILEKPENGNDDIIIEIPEEDFQPVEDGTANDDMMVDPEQSIENGNDDIIIEIPEDVKPEDDDKDNNIDLDIDDEPVIDFPIIDKDDNDNKEEEKVEKPSINKPSTTKPNTASPSKRPVVNNTSSATSNTGSNKTPYYTNALASNTTSTVESNDLEESKDDSEELALSTNSDNDDNDDKGNYVDKSELDKHIKESSSTIQDLRLENVSLKRKLNRLLVVSITSFVLVLVGIALAIKALLKSEKSDDNSLDNTDGDFEVNNVNANRRLVYGFDALFNKDRSYKMQQFQVLTNAKEKLSSIVERFDFIKTLPDKAKSLIKFTKKSSTNDVEVKSDNSKEDHQLTMSSNGKRIYFELNDISGRTDEHKQRAKDLFFKYVNDSLKLDDTLKFKFGYDSNKDCYFVRLRDITADKYVKIDSSRLKSNI